MKLFACLFVLLATAPVALAGTNCTDRPECWPEGSAMNMGLTAVQQRDATQKELARAYTKLVALVSSTNEVLGEEIAKPLQAAQDEWYKYSNAECSLVGALTGAGGSWPSTYTVQCELGLAYQRLRRVRSATRCINREIKVGYGLDWTNCLQQLAPIVNRM